MREIVHSRCHETLTMDHVGYADIVELARDREFDSELVDKHRSSFDDREGRGVRVEILRAVDVGPSVQSARDLVGASFSPARWSSKGSRLSLRELTQSSVRLSRTSVCSDRLFGLPWTGRD